MFGLLYETPMEWVGRVDALGLLPLLSDHAHCELKAAATMQALIAKNCEHERIVQSLPEVAQEELQHFQRVESELRRRGGRLAEQTASPYAEGLQRGAAKTRKSLLLDRLLLSHLIEARSAERFHLLGQHLEDRELADLYRDLLPSESAHRVLFLRLAQDAFSRSDVEQRLTELQGLEAQLLPGLPLEARIHSGMAESPAP